MELNTLKKLLKVNEMTTMQITVLLLTVLVGVGCCVYARLRALIDNLDYRIEKLEAKENENESR